MALRDGCFSDEFGLNQTFFNNTSVDRLVRNPEELEKHELILIGALLHQIDIVLNQEENQPTIELESKQKFSELHLVVTIIIQLNLLQPEDVQKVLKLAAIFDENVHQFKMNPGPALSEKSVGILQSRMSAPSTR